MERASALRVIALGAIFLLGLVCLAALSGAAYAHDHVAASYDHVSAAGHEKAGVVTDDVDDCQAGKPTRCSRTNVAHAIPVGEAPRASQLGADWKGARPRDVSLAGLMWAPEPTPPRGI